MKQSTRIPHPPSIGASLVIVAVALVVAVSYVASLGGSARGGLRFHGVEIGVFAEGPTKR